MERANYAVFAPRHVQDQAMAQFCTRCGTPLNGSDLFCPTCGTATNGGNNYYGDANTNWQFPPINPMNMRMPAQIPVPQQDLFNMLFALQQYYELIPKPQYAGTIPAFYSQSTPFYDVPVAQQNQSAPEESEEEPQEETPKKEKPASTAKKRIKKQPDPAPVDESEDVQDETDEEEKAIADTEEKAEAPKAATPKAAPTKSEKKSATPPPVKLRCVAEAKKAGNVIETDPKPERRQTAASVQAPHETQVKRPAPPPRTTARPQAAPTIPQAPRPAPPRYNNAQPQPRPAFGQSIPQPSPAPLPDTRSRSARGRAYASVKPIAQPSTNNLPMRYELRNEDGYYNDTIPPDGGYQKNRLSRTQIIKMILVVGGMGVALLVVFGFIPAIFG